ncbi:MAG: glycosyltransferase, partial [Candidatus Binataceae bacterium]
AYRRACCVVLPSVYKTLYGDETRVPELLGQTLLEAMACGTPVICTEVASMPEIVEDGVNGFIVPPNDPTALREKIAWLLNNPHHAAAMGKAGRQRVLDRFTWPAVVRRCLEAYAS